MDVKFAPLLTLLVVTGIATSIAHVLPPGRKLHGLALLLDFVPFAGAVVATVITTLRRRRAPLPWLRLAASVYGYFAGALIGALGVAHSVAVVMTSISRGRQNEFVYSFHVYSLVLLGMLLIATGVVGATQAAYLARGDRAAWGASTSVWTAIVAINLPLIPLQGFAILFSLLAVLQLLLLARIRRQFRVQSVSELHEQEQQASRRKPCCAKRKASSITAQAHGRGSSG